MRIFSKHRRKLEPKRRFGGRDFQSKVRQAQNYKRVFSMPTSGKLDKFWEFVGLRSKFWRRLGFLIVAALFYFFVISSQMVIADFQISGNSQISTQMIQDVLHQESNKRIFLVKKANYFFLGRNSVNKILTAKIPTIKEVTEYKRIWPNKAELVVKERTPGFAVKSSESFFLIDDEGVVVKPLDEPGDLLVAENTVPEDFASGEAFPNPKMAPFILSMSRAWPSKFDTLINGVKFPGKASNDVQFNSSEGWSVMFDINRSAAEQLNNLSILLTQQIPAKDRFNLAYIDLRSSKWAYYCYKGSACEQKPQGEEVTTGETTVEAINEEE